MDSALDEDLQKAKDRQRISDKREVLEIEDHFHEEEKVLYTNTETPDKALHLDV